MFMGFASLTVKEIGGEGKQVSFLEKGVGFIRDGGLFEGWCLMEDFIQ